MRYELHWIDKDAEQGPVFRIGDKDIYHRERPGQRALRLKAIHAPDMGYLDASVRAFAELSAHWGGPIVFIIDPDVRKPPAARFLYEWSRAAYANGSVDQSFMVTHNAFSHMLARLVLRMFAAGGMPFEAIQGEEALSRRLDELDLALPVEGFTPPRIETALAVRRGLGEGAYGQLVRRLVRRLRGGPPPA